MTVYTILFTPSPSPEKYPRWRIVRFAAFAVMVVLFIFVGSKAVFVNVVVASSQAACFNSSGRIRSGFNQT
jgi:uncharacterized membrane protein YjjP (DUF1212 family)